MPNVELIWPPHPFDAGFCITDDTDAAEMSSVSIVYDFLSSIGLRTTKTVWAFRPTEPCGIPPLPASIQRGITLEDPDYLRYCTRLGEAGFDICLHGASAGNNPRERTEAAFHFLDRHVPPSPTYICHAKNAENIYWQEKVVARGPLRRALNLYAKGHQCSGEDPDSPYFWGDLCRQRIRYIRLLRTARINTLAANPSMPYFEREKPFVRGWFSATKRSFRDCTQESELSRLEREHGVCILYQYLCRYADLASGLVRPAFRASAERLMGASGIWVATTSAILDRLAAMQGIVCLHRDRALWLLNVGDAAVENVQILTRAELARNPGVPIRATGDRLVVESLAARSIVGLDFTEPVECRWRASAPVGANGRSRHRLAYADLAVNLSETPWEVAPHGVISPMSFVVRPDAGLEEHRPTSRPEDSELTRLFLEQTGVILREFAFKGRSLDSGKWLKADRIELEDHDRW